MNIYNLLCKDTVTRDSEAHMTSQKYINCSVRCRFDFGSVEFFYKYNNYIIKTFRFHFSFEQPLNICELTRGFCPPEHMGDDTINLKIKGGEYPSLQFLIPMAYRLKGGQNYTPKLLFAVVVLTQQLTKCNVKKVRALTNTPVS